MHHSMHGVLLCAALLLSLSSARAPEQSSADGQVVTVAERPRSMLVAILPDRTTGRPWGMPYLDEAVVDLERIGPDAVFSVGDMIQGYTRDPARWDREADEYLASIAPLRDRFHPVAGNHDVMPGSRDPADRSFLERYRARFGPLWYRVDFPLATFVVLFSDEGLSDRALVFSEEQHAWLARTLDEASQRERPIVVLLHRPLWRAPAVAWRERVQPLLERAGVDLVLAGHFHSLQQDDEIGGVAYQIVGTCGGMIDQHPLAGQLQHITLLSIDERGALRLWHQPVGSTLPADEVVDDDQERVFALTSGRDVARWSNAVEEAWPRHSDDAKRATPTLVVRNPIDRPIRVVVRPVQGPEPFAFTPGRRWFSTTRIDADNPYTTLRATPWRIEAPTAIAIESGEEAQIELGATCVSCSTPTAPPEVLVEATFVDSKGRDVPVWLRRSMPIARSVDRGVIATTELVWPIAVWTPSPYDVLEPNPEARLAFDSAGRLIATIDLVDGDRPDDDAAVPAEVLAARPEERWTNPMHDAIRIELSDDRGERIFFVEPFRQTPGTGDTPAGPRLFEARDGALVPVEASVEVDIDPVDAPRARVRVEVPVTPATDGPIRLQIGVADNDRTFHTQWRWLAPQGHPMVLLPTRTPD
jgi:hypothetical protein